MPSLNLSNGVSLSYFSHPDERPSPSRPTVVLLSALLQRAEIQYTPQIRDARLAGFNFVGIDVHGHGDTIGRETWDMVDNVNDAVEGLKLLGVEKFFLLGSSQGGITAQEIAIRYPENVRGLVLIASTARPFGDDAAALFRNVLVPAWVSSSPPPDAALQGAMGTTFGAPPKPVDAPGSVFGDRAGGQPTVLEGAERTAESAVGLELLSRVVDNWRTHTGERKTIRPIDAQLDWTGSESRLGGLKIPVLVIHGVDDPSVAFERSEQIMSLLPENKLTKFVKLDGKGAHIISVLLDVAPEVNATLGMWLEECVKEGL